MCYQRKANGRRALYQYLLSISVFNNILHKMDLVFQLCRATAHKHDILGHISFWSTPTSFSSRFASTIIYSCKNGHRQRLLFNTRLFISVNECSCCSDMVNDYNRTPTPWIRSITSTSNSIPINAALVESPLLNGRYTMSMACECKACSLSCAAVCVFKMYNVRGY